MSNNVFFIVGFPRSGTTLLASLLNKHSKICIPPETHFFNKYAKRTVFPIKPENIESEVSKLINFSRVKDLELTETEIMSKIDSSKPTNKASLFIALLTSYGEKFKKIRMGEKTPVHMLHINEIKGLFPDAKIIFIARDGRDCMNSLLKTPWHHDNYLRHAAEWNFRMNFIARIKVKHKNILIVKYEDLIIEPEKILKEILNFIGESYENEMLSNSNTNSNLVPEWEKEWKGKVNNEIDKSRVYPWKKDQDYNKIDLSTRIMKKNLALYNYETNLDRLPLTFQNKLKNRFISFFFNKYMYDLTKVFYFIKSKLNSILPKTVSK